MKRATLNKFVAANKPTKTIYFSNKNKLNNKNITLTWSNNNKKAWKHTNFYKIYKKIKKKQNKPVFFSGFVFLFCIVFLLLLFLLYVQFLWCVCVCFFFTFCFLLACNPQHPTTNNFFYYCCFFVASPNIKSIYQFTLRSRRVRFSL